MSKDSLDIACRHTVCHLQCTRHEQRRRLRLGLVCRRRRLSRTRNICGRSSMVSGNGSRWASASKRSRVAMHTSSIRLKRKSCMPGGYESLRPATWASGKAKWWEKLLGLGPRASLVQELGAQHNVTLQAFAHAACLVSQPTPVALQFLQAIHRLHSLL